VLFHHGQKGTRPVRPISSNALASETLKAIMIEKEEGIVKREEKWR
jgi:hypothetical protein